MNDFEAERLIEVKRLLALVLLHDLEIPEQMVVAGLRERWLGQVL